MAAAVTVVELEESDVPGSFLSDLLGAHNVAALRMWLTCHGLQAPSSLRKAELTARCINCMIHTPSYRICQAKQEGARVVDIDGSFLSIKHARLSSAGMICAPLPHEPPLG